MSPDCAFGRDYILAVDIERAVHIDGFWEVVAARAYLGGGLGVCDMENVYPGGDDEEDVAPDLLEWLVLGVPGPLDDKEATVASALQVRQRGRLIFYSSQGEVNDFGKRWRRGSQIRCVMSQKRWNG